MGSPLDGLGCTWIGYQLWVAGWASHGRRWSLSGSVAVSCLDWLSCMLVVYRLFVVGPGFFGWVKLVFFVFRLVAVSSCLPVCLIWRSLGEWLVGELSGWIGLHVGRVSALGRWLGFPGTSLGSGWVGRRELSRLIELHVGIVSAFGRWVGCAVPRCVSFCLSRWLLGGCVAGYFSG